MDFSFSASPAVIIYNGNLYIAQTIVPAFLADRT